HTGERVFEHIEDGLPVHARALHRDVSDLVREEPVPQHQQLRRRRSERPHVLRAPHADAGRYGFLVYVQASAPFDHAFHGAPSRRSSATARRSVRITTLLGVLKGNSAGSRSAPTSVFLRIRGATATRRFQAGRAVRIADFHAAGWPPWPMTVFLKARALP